MGLTRRYLRFLGEHQSWLWLVGLAVLLRGVAEITMPLVARDLFDHAIPDGDARRAHLALAVGGGAFVVGFFGHWLRALAVSDMVSRAMSSARRRLYESTTAMPLVDLEADGSGDLTTRFSGDLGVVEQALQLAVPSTLFGTLLALGSLAAMIFLDWRLTLLTAGGVLLSATVPRLLTRRATEASYRRRSDEAALVTVLQDVLRGQKVIRTFDLGARWRDRFHAQAETLASSSRQLARISSLAGSATSLTISLVILVILAAGATMALDGEILFGTLLGFFALLINVATGVDIVSRAVPEALKASGALARVEELLDRAPAGACTRGPVDAVGPLRVALEVRDLVFTHGGGARIFDGLDLSIEAGTAVAIVGPSGSGKSTLLGVIAGFNPMDSGQLLWDGQPIGDPRAMRGQLAAVFQDALLFDTTVHENLRMVRPKATPDDLVAACRDAEVYHAICQLPQGFETEVGEGGARISGGQRQRLAIARALLCQPSVLVLDEATSALDPGSEAAINATIETLRGDRTIVSVTHRLSAVATYDRVVVLDGGVIVEQGTHDALMAIEGGLYRALVHKQSGFDLNAAGTVATITPARLRQVPAFAALSEDVLGPLARQFVTEHHAAGADIVRQGEDGDRFYIIVRGQADVLHARPGRAAERLARLEEGDLFGEIALLARVPRVATVRCATRCMVLALARSEFEGLMRACPDVHDAIRAEARGRLGRRAVDRTSAQAVLDKTWF